MSGMPAASAISRSPASIPSASRGSPQGSAIAVRKWWRLSSATWSIARPYDGPTLGIAHRVGGKPLSQSSSASYSASVMW